MREIYEGLKKTIDSGKPVILCTIIASSGSTPRGTGAMMVVTEEGICAGSIGGGAIEYKSIEIAKNALVTKNTYIHSFQLRRNDIQDIGMICGGDAEVLFSYIDPAMPETMEKYLEIEKEVEKLARVYIFGGGHVAQALVPVLNSLEFQCTVLDDRDDFIKPELFGGVAKTIKMNLEDVTSGIEITENDFVCIMTRGHKDDLEVEYQILKTPAKYIGVIGSSKKSAGVNRQLTERGINPKDIKRVTTPIGYKLKGAQTPAEIAICIAAQLIEVRAGYPARGNITE
ncbi:MAG: xanthine dehydrogenase accessory protein XdhC [Eubacteriales bacterium]|nr:xanthine dehydrogenase accessory protein XdhC [Eubacteriales bacterium]